MQVKDIPEQFKFVSDSQDVEAVANHFGLSANAYDSFFVLVADGDYVGAYGMEGKIPYDSKTVESLI